MLRGQSSYASHTHTPTQPQSLRSISSSSLQDPEHLDPNHVLICENRCDLTCTLEYHSTTTFWAHVLCMFARNYHCMLDQHSMSSKGPHA